MPDSTPAELGALKEIFKFMASDKVADALEIQEMANSQTASVRDANLVWTEEIRRIHDAARSLLDIGNEDNRAALAAFQEGMMRRLSNRPPTIQRAEVERNERLTRGRAALLQTAARIQSLRHPAELREYLSGPLVDTLRQMETYGESAERLCDLVVVACNTALPIHPSMLLSDPLCRMIARLHANLLRQTEERDANYYATWLALGQLADRYGGERGAAAALWYYNELVIFGPAQTGAAVLRIAANNLAGEIANRLQRQDKEASAEAAPLLHRLQRLALAARLQESDISVSAAPALGALFAQIGWPALVEPTVALRTAAALQQMGNVSSSWRIAIDHENQIRQHGNDWLALINIASAFVRMVVNPPVDHDEIAASLFNAGVNLLRRGKEENIDSAPALRARLNALGLRWALEKACDLEQALEVFQGFDCAVNLFGALTDLQPDEAQRKIAGQLAASLLIAGKEIGSSILIDVFRLQSSARQLNLPLNFAHDAVTDLVALQQNTHALLASLDKTLTGPLTEFAKPGVLDTVLAGMQTLLGNDRWSGLVADLGQFLGELIDPVGEPDVLWQHWSPQWLPPNDPPAVAAGVFNAEQWQAIGEQAQGQPMPFAEALREALNS